ncbi:MAG: radical SAM protein [Chloroflexi bacterium]|nr:radical SAM protein [Chloroflexota bacterium]
MKITLVQPRLRNNPYYVHEPLNLGYLASYLIERGYKDIQIRIAAFEADETILAAAQGSNIVAFTATSPMMSHARELAARVKQACPGAFIVFGGVHATVLPESSLRDPSIDAVARGEGEETFFQLVRAIDRGESFAPVGGLSYKDAEGKIRHNPDRSLVQDVDTIPFPARGLMSQSTFLDMGEKKYGDRGAWVFSSRGCPFRCTYCASHQAWTRAWRARTPQNIIGEIDQLIHGFGANRINFADDTFSVSRSRLLAFCGMLREKGWPITWGCNVRVDTVNRDLLEEMRRSGCTDVWMGVESGSPTILREIQKGITVEQIRNVFRWAREAGLRRRAYLMLGSPSESMETIRETEQLVEDIQPDFLAFSILTPYPGCDDYDRAKKQGYVGEDTDWSGVDLFHGDAALMDTKHLSREDLKREHRRLTEKFKKLYKV